MKLAGDVNVGWGLSPQGCKEGMWSCGAGFALEKITDVSLETKGGVSYEKVTVF